MDTHRRHADKSYPWRWSLSVRDLPATFGDIGPRARALWIRSARKILLEGDGTASGPTSGINARDILLDGGQTAEEYLALMSQNNPRPTAWGGERELHVLTTLWRCRICTLLLRNDPREGPQTRLLWGPVGTVGEIHTLLFNGGHYDLVKLTQEQLVMLGLLP